MQDGAPPAVIVLLAASICVLTWRRPSVPLTAAPVLGMCLVVLLLTGWPMIHYGFRWIANANDDMANYVLSATELVHHGLLAHVDLAGLSNNSNYASLLSSLHLAGARPGADITLAGLASLTGRPAYAVFMPLILALAMCTIAGTAALAMQATRRWWAAAVAAALLAVSPLTAYGALQEFLPQVWGLGLATALCALLMRRELHQAERLHVREALLAGILTAALVAVYVEFAATVALAYVVYALWLMLRHQLVFRVAIQLWASVLFAVVVVLNRYGLRELHFVSSQTSSGVHGLLNGPPLFGFTLVPGALTGVVGLQTLPAQASPAQLELSIGVAVVLLAVVAFAAVWGAVRGVAAAFVLITYGAIGVFLGIESSDFGLFKLYMYVQPFLAATIAVWIASAKRRRTLAIIVFPVVVLLALQIHTQQTYVKASRIPQGLHNASSLGLLPAFREIARSSRDPIVTVTENPSLGSSKPWRASQDKCFSSVKTSSLPSCLPRPRA